MAGGAFVERDASVAARDGEGTRVRGYVATDQWGHQTSDRKTAVRGAGSEDFRNVEELYEPRCMAARLFFTLQYVLEPRFSRKAMVDVLKNRGKHVKERILAEARGRVREKAIRRAKSRIALNNRRIEDFSEDQLEALVAEEEETLLSRLWQMPLAAVLVALGLS